MPGMLYYIPGAGRDLRIRLSPSCRLCEPEAGVNNLYGRLVAPRWTVAVALPLPAGSMAGLLPTIPDVYVIGAIVTKTRISVFALTP